MSIFCPQQKCAYHPWDSINANIFFRTAISKLSKSLSVYVYTFCSLLQAATAQLQKSYDNDFDSRKYRGKRMKWPNMLIKMLFSHSHSPLLFSIHFPFTFPVLLSYKFVIICLMRQTYLSLLLSMNIFLEICPLAKMCIKLWKLYKMPIFS